MKNEKDNINKLWKLSPKEKLRLHQLQAKQYWFEKLTEIEKTSKEYGQQINKFVRDTFPEKWLLLKNINLYEWQSECIDKWFFFRSKRYHKSCNWCWQDNTRARNYRKITKSL